jgi:hypothetical protein
MYIFDCEVNIFVRVVSCFCGYICQKQEILIPESLNLRKV